MSTYQYARLALTVMVTLVVVLTGAAFYLATDSHLVRCKVVNSATYGLFGDDPDGEPMTVCWDVITGERVA